MFFWLYVYRCPEMCSKIMWNAFPKEWRLFYPQKEVEKFSVKAHGFEMGCATSKYRSDGQVSSIIWSYSVFLEIIFTKLNNIVTSGRRNVLGVVTLNLQRCMFSGLKAICFYCLTGFLSFKMFNFFKFSFFLKSIVKICISYAWYHCCICLTINFNRPFLTDTEQNETDGG